MKIFNVISILFFLMACNNGNKSEETITTDPLKKIADTYHITVVRLPKTSKAANAENLYTIKIDNLNLKTTKAYEPVFIASKSAEIIYESFKTGEEENIQVNVNSIVKTDVFNFKVENIKNRAILTKIGRSGVEKLIKGDYDSFFKMVDSKYFTEEAYNKCINDHIKLHPEAYKGIDKIKDFGFSFDEYQGHNIAIMYFRTTSSNNVTLEYAINIINNDNPKIAGFNIYERNF